MPEQPWFRLWAKEALASTALAAMTDHQERVWWRLLMVASLEEPRWRVSTTTPALARMCVSTPPKLMAALTHLQSLGMVEGVINKERVEIAVSNALKYNPPRKPSDAPEAIRERVQKHRDTRKETRYTPPDVTRFVTPETGTGNALPSRAIARAASASASSSPDPISLSGEEEEKRNALHPPDEETPFTRCVREWERLTGTLINSAQADDLDEALRKTSEEWTLDAIRETARQGKASTKYMLSIVLRWQASGKEGRNGIAQGHTQPGMRDLADLWRTP